MSALFANGPALFPTPGAPASEWAVWGACATVAAVLGGWGLLNHRRPERDTPVGVALLIALVLTASAVGFATVRNLARQAEQNRLERESSEERNEQNEIRRH